MVGGLLEHGCEAEEFTAGRLVHHHFLVILVDRGDAHSSREQHVRLASGLPLFVDPFARREFLQFDLSGEHGALLSVEQGE